MFMGAASIPIPPISTYFTHPSVPTPRSSMSGAPLSVPSPSGSDSPFESHRQGYKNLEFPVSQAEYIQQYFETEKTRLQTRVNKSYISSQRFHLEEDFSTARAVIDLQKDRLFPAGEYHINFDFVSIDPYSRFHPSDIHQLYTDPVTDKTLNRIRLDLESHSTGVGLNDELGGALIE